MYSGCTGGKQKSTKEFISGNKKLSVFPTMLSLLVSYQSAILILGMTAEVGVEHAYWRKGYNDGMGILVECHYK